MGFQSGPSGVSNQSGAIDLTAALAAKAALAGATYTGAHDFTGATVTGIPGGLALIASGTVTAGSALSINNCFSATYDHYRIVVDSNVATTFRFRVGGVDDSSNNYWFQYGEFAGAASYAGRVQGTSGVWITGIPAAMDVYRPFLASTTVTSGLSMTASTSTLISMLGNFHNVASSFDGITLLGTSMTATAYVYGYRKA